MPPEMALEIERSPQARSDELDIWLHIATDNVGAADRILDRLDDVVRMPARHPAAGRSRSELGEGMRSHPVEAYVIFYRHNDSTLTVVRILSALRDTPPKLFD